MFATYRPSSMFLSSKSVSYNVGESVDWNVWHNFMVSAKIDEETMTARVFFYFDGVLVDEIADLEQTVLYFGGGITAMTLGNVSLI